MFVLGMALLSVCMYSGVTYTSLRRGEDYGTAMNDGLLATLGLFLIITVVLIVNIMHLSL